MSKQHKRVNRGHKVLVADINVSSKVSKLLYFCGCFVFLCYSGWISSSFVAADIHTYGPNDFKGLLLTFPCRYFYRSCFSFPLFWELVQFSLFSLKLIFILIQFKRGSDFKSTNFRTKYNRTNKLYSALQICTKQIGWSGVLRWIQCGKLCEYLVYIHIQYKCGRPL